MIDQMVINFTGRQNGKPDPVTPGITHGGSNESYIGVNRLFYDGHVKWFNESSAAHTQYSGGPEVLNTAKEAVWRFVYGVN